MTAELEAKIRDVLLRLSMLGNGSTSNLDPATSHGKAESGIPVGLNEDLGRSVTDEPKRDAVSPYEWWCWRFTKALVEGEPDFDIHRLYLLAEREYGERTLPDDRRRSLRKGELTENDIRDGGMAEREAAKRVIDFYEGVSAVEVAVFEYASESWVKKIRRMHKRQPHDGTPRPEFLDLNEDARRRTVAALHARGMKLTKAAHRLRVDKNTVKRYWPAAETTVVAAV